MVTPPYCMNGNYYKSLQQEYHITDLRIDKVVVNHRWRKDAHAELKFLSLYMDCLRVKMEIPHFIEEIRSW